MYSNTRYSTENLFSPLDGDIGVVAHFEFRSNEGEQYVQPKYKRPYPPPQASQRTSIPRKPVPKRPVIPRKPVPVYDRIPSFNSSELTMETTKHFDTEKAKVLVKEKRGWRFYGTFACLAILNLICAIDATILAVALPVGQALSISEIC